MPKAQINFEKLYKELEEIVAKFETGEIELEQGLKEFERGLELAQQLKARLTEIENQVEEVKKKFNNEN